VLRVDGSGGYSLRAYPEATEAPSRNLLAVGVMRSEGIVAVRPEEARNLAYHRWASVEATLGGALDEVDRHIADLRYTRV
jgi:hypothetical protein